ncbi:MAG: SAM-dependent methyltransferase [Ruminococcus sp.]|nr:SAM-dependent methyltransferase [Ruminococcus sp.]
MTPILKPDGRLHLCADMVRRGSRLADIGTDHGYLPIALCLEGKIPSALACDINPMPLKSAQENIARYGLSNKIQTRLSDGLKAVRPEETNDIAIAGMGGELIRDILASAEWVKDETKKLILQPMTHHEDLVLWLYENGFMITAQKAAFDEGKYYTALSACYTGEKRTHSLSFAVVGMLDLEEKVSRWFIRRCLQNYRNKSKGDPSFLRVVNDLEELLQRYEYQ